MATYNLNHSSLDKLLDSFTSSATENAIFQALIGADLMPEGHRTLGVETQSVGGFYTVPAGDNFFLDTGLSNLMTLSSALGGVVIAAGDGGNSILDQGPGGDTLVGGAGADKLQVTQGDNVLIGGGFETVGGGTGHDFMTGGASLLGPSDFDHGRSGDRGNRGDDHDGHGNGGDDGGSDDRGHGHHHHGQTFPSDTLIGGSGNDLIEVSHGDNWIYAGTGHDTIYAGDGSDKIFGSTIAGATNAMDTIYLGTGDASITGGAAGAATIYAGKQGDDTILGSLNGQTLDLYTEQSSHDVKSTSVSGGITTITFKDHQTLVLENVTIHYSK
jgi:Ca2+-binding RTX toxin-like protein